MNPLRIANDTVAALYADLFQCRSDIDIYAAVSIMVRFPSDV